MRRSKLDIIVITYNNEKNILVCLSSLEKCSPQKNFYIVDNASRDNTCRIIKNKFLQARLIKNKKNLGFAAAVNRGAKIAKGEYLLFLNPDTIVKSNCIEKMVEFLEKKKDAGIVGCKILNPDGSLQPSCGNFPTILNIIFDRILFINVLFATELIRQKSYYKKEQSPDWVSGAFFLTRKDVFEKLGGFDERYFMYGEDVDFCYRAKKAGYKIYYTPDVGIIHYNQGASKERKNFKAKQMRKGFTIFFEKYKSPFYVFLWKTILGIEQIFRPSLR